MKVGVAELVSNGPRQDHEHIQTQPENLNERTDEPHDGVLINGEGGHGARKDAWVVMIVVNGWKVWVGTLGCLNFIAAQVITWDLNIERCAYRLFFWVRKGGVRVLNKRISFLYCAWQ